MSALSRIILAFTVALSSVSCYTGEPRPLGVIRPSGEVKKSVLTVQEKISLRSVLTELCVIHATARVIQDHRPVTVSVKIRNTGDRPLISESAASVTGHGLLKRSNHYLATAY